MTFRRRAPKLALVVDPRFSGGTSSAVAREILALAPHVELQVFGLETKMFKGREVNPRLQSALDEVGIALTWDPKVIRSEFVAIHNPSCLKFNADLDLRIICDTAFAITHENLLRPCGGEGFDVSLCLDLIDRRLLCRNRFLVPVSGYNAENVRTWLTGNQLPRSRWKLAEFQWFNICEFETHRPTTVPRDRRGRHSRAGFEKFPDLDIMKRHFPEHAERCAILGGDSFLLDLAQIPPHWDVLPFGSVDVDEFLEDIDFFVYYTNANLQESFGRVIGEAIAAGKVVITDPKTAQSFGGAVIASDGADIDTVIEHFVSDPQRYQDFVLRAQQSLLRFESSAFTRQILAELQKSKEAVHDLF